MSTILLKFDVLTSKWPRIGVQPLEFNFEFYFGRFRGEGEGRFAEFQQKVRIVGLSLSSL